MSKYGGGILLLLVVAALCCCCGCLGGDSILSGGQSQTFGSEATGEQSSGLTLSEALADLSINQNEEAFSFTNQSYLAVRGIRMTGDGRASSWAVFARPENEDRTVVLIYSEWGWSEYNWKRSISYPSFEPAEIMYPDEIFLLHEEKLSEYFTGEGNEADVFLSNGTYVVTVYGPEVYETFRFDAYTGEWVQ